MFVPRTFHAMRIIAIVAVIAIITLVTAFDYEASDLPFTSDGTPATPDAVTLDEIGQFIAPIEILTRPGDDRTFIVELMGAVVATNGATTETVLDVSALTMVDGERGLLGAAFHPTESLLYVHHTNLEGNSVLVEYAIDAATAIADPTSERTVLVVEQPYENHNGGELAFGPDGYLYAGFGDGGLADDPVRSALDLSSRLGKILRIDPRQSGDEPFLVPADNPFVNTEGADPTIWALGLRNPWKFSFDPTTGDLWIGDVGQNQWEEINVVPDNAAGLSFGWSAFEGNERFNEDQTAAGHTGPVVTYARAEGKCSISGGAVYRGTNESLDGWYLYGDYCTGQIFGFDTAASDADRQILELGHVDALVAIAAGPDGELYAASVAGPVFRIG